MSNQATSVLAGTTLLGYTVVRVEKLEQLQGQFIELRHQRTGSRHIHIACADPNNAFAVTFPTIPQDSTGIAHILEHVVLTGSKRYPVRDPFFSMIPRSLSTFMNAMTYPAFTCYPFSSRNQKDYFNLLSVYLDACFFPELKENSFKQEGWRFEFSEPENPASPLEYKGVVYNEMKGANSSVPRIMHSATCQAMLPDTTFANDAGGAVEHIPDLTWQALKAFHARHYHPSNAYFYTYGNLPIEQTLQAIESQVLEHFDLLDIDSSIPSQPRFATPKTVYATYPASNDESLERKSQVLVNWLAGFAGDSFETLSWRILQDVLLANAASPLRRALIESKIGSALADGTGLNDLREMLFSAGLKDVASEDAPKIEALIFETLSQLVQNGINVEGIDAAIHQLEIDAREANDSGYPYALKVMFRMSEAYLYGGDPYKALQFDQDIKRLEAERAKGGYFEGMIQKHLLDNPHRVTVVLEPDPNLNATQEAHEKTKLEAIKAQLSPAQSQSIINDAMALKAEQDAQQDLSSLPTLELSDVPMNFEDIPQQRIKVGDNELGLFSQPTNGLFYLSLHIDSSTLPDTLKDLLPFFAFLTSKLGAGNSNYLQVAERIERHTGGIAASVGVRVSPHDLGQHREGFSLGGKALNRNASAFFAIIKDILSDLQFDPTQLRNLLGQYRAGLEARIVPSGHLYALSLADAQLSSAGALRERFDGLTQIETARRIANPDDTELEGLIDDLKTIRDGLYRQGMRICITSEPEQLEPLKAGVLAIIDQLPAAKNSSASTLANPKLHATARTTAVPVAYDALAVPTVPYTHNDAAALFVLAQYLRQTYLHPEIREKGGAYGGFAVSRVENGLFAQLSYRDPHIVRTFGVYQQAAKHVIETPIKTEDLKEAILSSCGAIDPLLSADRKGITRFGNDNNGYTLQVLEHFKRRLLTVSSQDLRHVAQKYLEPSVLESKGAYAVIADKDKIEAANQELGQRFTISPA